MNAVDVLLFEKLDIYRRLSRTFDDAEERFWRQLGKTVGVIVKEIGGLALKETFSTPDFWDNSTGCAYRSEWLLDFGSAGEDLDEWRRVPSFWFPCVEDEYDTFALTGLDEELDVTAAIWGQPLSRFTGDLASTKQLWNKFVAGPLRTKGWEPYGEKVTTPTGEWGMKTPIRLDHHDIAKAMESAILRPALNPLQKAVEDFASVSTGIDKIIETLRASKRPSKQKT